MIALVKKSVNHPRTVASMRETCEMNSLLVLSVVAFFAVIKRPTCFRGNVELKFPFLLVLGLSLHAVYNAKNGTSEH